MDNFEALCPGCFLEKEKTATCAHCGFDESGMTPPGVLDFRTLLDGRYLTGRILGKPGGFGITYLGWDVRLQTKVAVKEYLPRDLATRHSDGSSVSPYSEEEGELFSYGLQQFLQEAQTLAKFDHANVVRVRTFFEENQTAYLVMDYYNGMSLAEYLQTKGGKLPEKLAMDIMMPILDGLREVHDKGFLHRDVKPANIYLTEEGRPILLDFGAARFAMGDRSRSLSAILTPGYAPFEQYHRKGKHGAWTDIYACGATLYHMVTGFPPPEANERMAVDELKPPQNAVEGVSAEFSQTLMKALERSEERRYQNIASFQTALLDPNSAPSPSPQETTPLPEQTATSQQSAPAPPPELSTDHSKTKIEPKVRLKSKVSKKKKVPTATLR